MTTPLTQQAQEFIGQAIQPGDEAIDATAGNGHDTLFLARAAGPTGTVYAFDIQPAALEATRDRLRRAGLDERVRLIRCGHEELQQRLPPGSHGKIQAVMFNLGYLPGSDQRIVTRPHTTLLAIEQAAEMLAPGGRMTVLAYRGHEGGEEETQAVTARLMALEGWQLVIRPSSGPILLALTRLE